MTPAMFFARADNAKPPPVETATAPEATSFSRICLMNTALPTSWWRIFTGRQPIYNWAIKHIGEVSVGAGTITFRSWSKTHAAFALAPAVYTQLSFLEHDLEIRLSDIASVRLGTPRSYRIIPYVILQHRTVDGSSDETMLSGWGQRPTRQLHDAIAARHAAHR